jgi:hypothetical protein
LEELLSIFEQAHFVKDGSKISKLYPHRASDEDVQFIAYVLHETIADPIELAEIEKEVEAIRVFECILRTAKLKAIEERINVLKEQMEQLEEMKRLLGDY